MLSYILTLLYSWSTFIVFLMCGIECYYWTDATTQDQSYPTAFMNQVASDWRQKPYTHIQVVIGKGCPEELPESVVSRPYHGSMIGCDCRGVPWGIF